MRAVGYCRVSTVGQAKEGVSLDSQQSQIKAWTQVNNAQHVKTYTDAGISGFSLAKRPALQSAIEKVCAIHGVLVVSALSRLGRNTREVLSIADQLERAGADLVSLSEKLDTTSAAGKMQFRLLALLAEFERDLISERTKTAMQHAKKQGRRVGTIPFGWNLGEDGRHLLPDEKEQEAIQMMREMRERRKTYREIGWQLERRGIPTKQGGSTWHAMTVRNIIRLSC